MHQHFIVTFLNYTPIFLIKLANIYYTMRGGRVTLKDPWIFYIIIVKVKKINQEKIIPWVIHSVHKPHYLLVQAQETCED